MVSSAVQASEAPISPTATGRCATRELSPSRGYAGSRAAHGHDQRATVGRPCRLRGGLAALNRSRRQLVEMLEPQPAVGEVRHHSPIGRDARFVSGPISAGAANASRRVGGAGSVLSVQAAMLPTAIPVAIIATRARRRVGRAGATAAWSVVAAPEPSVAETIAIRASPISRSRVRGSRLRQRPIRARNDRGVVSGIVSSEISWRKIEPRISGAVSPSKSRSPQHLATAPRRKPRYRPGGRPSFPRACSGVM